ncbi:MAG TPA: cupin domain-containing protein [Pirellulales bacterium]|nr:cupin domain-containing protein [Pirellulales bacterium]
MAIHHAAAAEVIDVRPLGAALKDTLTKTLVKTDTLEVIRIVLPAGKQLPPHRVEGEITVQCLEGRLAFDVEGTEHELAQGQMLYLAGGATHALRGIEDASVLVAILLR